jgi:hypothetical protein
MRVSMTVVKRGVRMRTTTRSETGEPSETVNTRLEGSAVSLTVTSSPTHALRAEGCDLLVESPAARLSWTSMP